MGQQILSALSGLLFDPMPVGFGYTLLFASYFVPLYPHNILWPKSVNFHTYISDLHADQISSDYFFLSDTL